MSLHKWTNGGDSVLVLRVIEADGTSHGGFKNATEPGSIIKCPDWSPEPECGNGLHGWPWGVGRSGKLHAGNKLWQVVKANPETGVDLDDKAKWPEFEVVYTGDQATAVSLLQAGLIAYNKQSGNVSGNFKIANSSGDYSSASSSGDRSSASSSGHFSSASSSGNSSSASSSGYSSSASSSGDSSSASASGRSSSANSSGYCSSASSSGYFSLASSSGYSSSASTSGHYSSASSSGNRSSAVISGDNGSSESTGESSVSVCVGTNCKAKTGKHGVIVLGWWNEDHIEYEFGKVGVNIKADTWYRLDENGNFKEV